MTEHEQDLRTALAILISRAEQFRKAHYHALSDSLARHDVLCPADAALTEAIHHAIDVLYPS